MKNVSLAALQIFKTVAEEGGITRAASRLHRVQSNVTTRVKQLEEQVGATLFHRRNRRLVLSAEGRLLLAYADQMLRLSSEAQAVLRGGSPLGTLRIGTLESTAAARLPPVLSRYHAAHPGVRIELVTGTTGGLVTRLLDYDIEAAFLAEPFTARAPLETQIAFREELVLIAPAGLARIRAPKDIGHATVIAFAAGCSYRRRLEAWLGAGRVVPERVMEFGSYHAIVACVAAGAGIAIVPRSIIAAVPHQRAVSVWPLPADVADAQTVLAWRRGAVSSALQALRGQLAAPPSKKR